MDKSLTLHEQNQQALREREEKRAAIPGKVEGIVAEIAAAVASRKS